MKPSAARSDEPNDPVVDRVRLPFPAPVSGSQHVFDCPFTSQTKITTMIDGYLHRQISEWGTGKLVVIDRCAWASASSPRPQVGGVEFEKVDLSPLVWREEPISLFPSGGRATLFHADLRHEAIELHIDYFNFITWGPLHGRTGVVVSQHGEVLGVGGNWGCLAGTSCRNWPLGLSLGKLLLMAYAPPAKAGSSDSSAGVFLLKERSRRDGDMP